MNYNDTLEYLYNTLPVFQRIGAAAYKANLDNTLALDDYLRNPHREFRTIHIAGTNGKGSTSQMIYEVLRAHGYKTGLYTSPHLTDFRERIIVNDKMISESEVINFVAKHRKFIESIKPSFFEVTVAMAFDHFRLQKVDYAVIEVGMGGRLDSTNIVSPEISIITNIDYDHTQFLGDTLAEIATEKAGIIKETIPVVIGESNPETAVVFINKAQQEFAPITFADQRYQCNHHQGNIFSIHSLLDDHDFDIELGMTGDYQQKNLCTSLAALDILGEKITLEPQKVREGLARTKVRGRWHILSETPLTICDTGHNKAGITYILHQISQQNYKKLHFVIGMVNDKDIEGILAMLPKEAHYIFTKANIPRAMDARELCEKASKHGLHGDIEPSIRQAVNLAKNLATAEDMIFIGGSTFVVAEALE